jgi:hypothetical protein
MAKTLAQLTPTQQNAYVLIKNAGQWKSGDGIRLSTVEVLEREGLVTLQKISNGKGRPTWVAKPVKVEESKTPAKNPHKPTIVRLIKQELGFEKANMPEAGGFVAHSVLWEMVPVVMIGWAYEDENLRGHWLSPDVNKIAYLLKAHGYALHSLAQNKNFFFVVPESLRRTA